VRLLPNDAADADLVQNVYHLPLCPGAADTPTNYVTSDQADSWAVRGAINAGLSVFEYVKGLETASVPPPDYNQCPPP
jgi:hypothetical protein